MTDHEISAELFSSALAMTGQNVDRAFMALSLAEVQARIQVEMKTRQRLIDAQARAAAGQRMEGKLS